MANKLPRQFYTRSTLTVAKELLGKYLVFKNKSAKICEVEAYIGQNDRACHASAGKTKRNLTMFYLGGHSYVYLIYGIYHCLNLVTEKEGFPAAVLIRALEYPNANGPGKLCREFAINLSHNGLDLTDSQMYIEDRPARHASQGDADGGEPNPKIFKTPRIGVDYAGKDAKLPWRFCLKNSNFLSKNSF
jgi:DNA-3-methyladenine glycosylase